MISRRRFLRMLAFALPVLLLAACGKKGPPQHPEGSQYPRKYPSE
ncbi:LPS translocon maturation chaperone LptM [Magnetospira thiophila]